jgi:hypothetical protein
VVLTDDQQDPRSIPTKNNIVRLFPRRLLLPHVPSAVDSDAMASDRRATKRLFVFPLYVFPH